MTDLRLDSTLHQWNQQTANAGPDQQSAHSCNTSVFLCIFLCWQQVKSNHFKPKWWILIASVWLGRNWVEQDKPETLVVGSECEISHTLGIYGSPHCLLTCTIGCSSFPRRLTTAVHNRFHLRDVIFKSNRCKSASGLSALFLPNWPKRGRS